jgi:hypothetical protein
MKTINQLLTSTLLALDHTGNWIEPFLELSLRSENVGHQKMHERPQLNQIVLQRSAGQQQSMSALE